MSGVGRCDAWGAWTHVIRAALDASWMGEQTPLWLIVATSAGGLVLLPLGGAALTLHAEGRAFARSS